MITTRAGTSAKRVRRARLANTGPVVAGNIGSSKRMSYTVIGDAVNISEFIESMSKVYKTPLLVSRQTANTLSTLPPMREVDRICFNGKVEPVTLYEVIEALPPERRALVEENTLTFYGAIQLYRSKNWNQAQKAFKGILDSDPEDGIAEMYIGRCKFFADNPPPADWNGTWTIDNK